MLFNSAFIQLGCKITKNSAPYQMFLKLFEFVPLGEGETLFVAGIYLMTTFLISHIGAASAVLTYLKAM